MAKVMVIGANSRWGFVGPLGIRAAWWIRLNCRTPPVNPNLGPIGTNASSARYAKYILGVAAVGDTLCNRKKGTHTNVTQLPECVPKS